MSSPAAYDSSHSRKEWMIEFGVPPLHSAAFKGDVGALKTLVELRADIQVNDADGVPPLT